MIDLITTATLHPLVLPARADAGITPSLRTYAEVRNRSILESTGRDDGALSAEELLPVLYSSKAAEKRHWYIEQDGAMIGCMAVDILQDGGGESAIGVIAILQDHAGQGIGSQALNHMEAELGRAGVRHLLCWAEHRGDGTDLLEAPTGVGAVPRDGAAHFLQKRGFTLEQVERGSELRWNAGTIEQLEASLVVAQEHASDYRVVQWMLPTPDDHIDGYAWLKSRMSTDAPDAGMGLPEETWDSDRVRELEARQASKGFALQVTAAQHITTGELCAFNELAIRASAPEDVTHQFDTLVLSGHRGHRLGTLVKAAGLLGWHERFPESPRVITYNAEENRPMLNINEAIGFVSFAYEGAWKKDIA